MQVCSNEAMFGLGGAIAPLGPTRKKSTCIIHKFESGREKLNLVPKIPFKTMKESKEPHK